VNLVHKILICLQCEASINPEDPAKHLRNLHKGFDIREFKKQYEKIEFPCALLSDPPHPTEPIPPIPGLKIFEKTYACPLCNHAYSNTTSFKNHPCSIECPETSTPAQRFKDNNLSAKFPVLSALPLVALGSALWESYCKHKESREDSLDDAISDDFRVQEQFLTKSGWFKNIGDRAHEPLMEMVEYDPKSDIYKCVAPIVRRVMQYLQSFTVERLVLRRLIGTRPSSLRTSAYSRPHSWVTEPTVAKYARVLTQFILALHRHITNPTMEYDLKHTEALRSALLTFIASIDGVPDEPLTEYPSLEKEPVNLDHEGEETQTGPPPTGGHQERPFTSQEQTLMHFLGVLYTAKPGSVKEGPLDNPLHQFILLTSLRVKKQWRPASQITQTIAALTFCGRLTFAHLIHEHAAQHSLIHTQ
jgi:Orsellinic acid/F9775 biosynthesis cluster protein D